GVIDARCRRQRLLATPGDPAHAEQHGHSDQNNGDQGVEHYRIHCSSLTDGHCAPGRRGLPHKTAIRDPQTGCSCRIRWLITSVTPARIVTPYKASAISIVRFW